MVALTVYLNGKGLTSGWCPLIRNSFSYKLSIECIVLYYDWVRRWLVTGACLVFAYNFGWEHENLLAWQKYVFIPETVKTGLTFEPWFYRIVLQGVLCIMICYVFWFFCNNVVSVGWSSFCFTEASLCRHWQRNVRTCIWGVCIVTCTCKCWNSKWNLGLNSFNLQFKSQFLLFPNPNVTIHDHESSSLLMQT